MDTTVQIVAASNSHLNLTKTYTFAMCLYAQQTYAITLHRQGQQPGLSSCLLAVMNGTMNIQYLTWLVLRCG